MGLEVGPSVRKIDKRLLELSGYETPWALQCCGINTAFFVE